MSDSDILSRVQVLLDANTASFETGMKAAQETAAKSFDQISSHAKNMASVVVSALAADKIVDAADGYVQIGSRIKRATSDAEEYAMVQARILETANQTYRPLVEAQETYLATSAGLKEMGKNTEQTLDIIDSLSYAYTMNAASADQVRSANEWLSKSMIDNKVSGDAFKAFTLAADNLIQDLADHTGKSTLEIKKLGNAGKISLTDLMNTLEGTVDKNKRLAAEMPNSLKDGLTAVENNFNAFVGKANETYEITGILSSGLITLGEHMDELAVVAGMAATAYGTKKIIEYSESIKDSITQNIARTQALATERQALVNGAAAELSRTSAIATNLRAQVAATEAEALRLTGIQRLAFVEKTLVPLRAQSAIATQAEAVASKVHKQAIDEQTVATGRLAVAKRALMGLVGGPGGLIMLATSLAAGFAMMSMESDTTTESLAQQTDQVNELAKKYEKLNAAQVLIESGKIDDEIAKQNNQIQLQINKLTMLAGKNTEAWGIEALELYNDTVQKLKKGSIDGGEAVERLKKNSRFTPEVLRTISDYVVELDASRAAVKKKQERLDLLNKSFEKSKTSAGNAAAGIKAVANESANAVSKIFNLNDELDKLFKQADSNIISAKITTNMASRGADDKWISIVNKYAQIEGAITKNVEGRAVFHDEIKEKMRAEYNALIAQDKAIETRNKKEQERTKLLEQQGKVLQVNARVKANADKYNFNGLEKEHGLLPGLLSAINMQESKGDANAIGPMTKYGTAKGGFQMLDGTAQRFKLIGKNVFDTGKSAKAAAEYLEILYKRYGNWEKAISAYHAGEGNVDQGTNIGPVNRQYVKNVKGYVAGVNGMSASSDSNIDDAMKAQEEYVQLQLDLAEKRKQLELDVADYEVKVRSDLTDKIADIDAAGFDDAKATKLKAQYEKWAELDIAAFKDAQIEKLDSLTDYLKSEDELLIQKYARQKVEITRDRELSESQKTEAIKRLEEQKEYELKNIQFSRDKRIFEYRKAFMTSSEIMVKHYELERQEIERTILNVEEKNAALAASYQNEDLDNDVGRQDAWRALQETMGVDTSFDDEQKELARVFQAALDWKLITQEDYQRKMLENERAYHRARANVQMQYGMSYVQGAVGILGQVLGENSKAYQAMFEMQKAMAIAQVMMNAPTTFSNVYTSVSQIPYVGWVMAPVAAGAAVALQLAQAATIGSVSFQPSGMAHDGIDRIPEEGSWWLDKGERVLTEQTSSKLDSTLEDVRKNSSSKQSAEIPVLPQPISIYALDGKSVERVLSKNGGAVAKGLRNHVRNFGKK